MKKRSLIFLILISLLGGKNTSFAQYPAIPDSVQKASDALLKETWRLSDIAWQKAWKTIQYDATHGKPYIP